MCLVHWFRQTAQRRAQLLLILPWDCVEIITSTEMFFIKWPGHWKRWKPGILQPPRIQTRCDQGCWNSGVFHNCRALAGRGGDCWQLLFFPCEVLWACLLLKHRLSAVVNCLRPSGFHRTIPACSKWKLRWVSVLFTKEKENRDQQLAKWQTLREW